MFRFAVSVFVILLVAMPSSVDADSLGDAINQAAEKGWRQYHGFAKKYFPWMKGDYGIVAKLSAELLNMKTGVCLPFCLGQKFHKEMCEAAPLEKSLPFVYGKMFGKGSDTTICDLTDDSPKEFLRGCLKICNANLFRLPAIVLLEATRKIEKLSAESEDDAEAEEENDEGNDGESSGFSISDGDLDLIGQFELPDDEALSDQLSSRNSQDLPTWASFAIGVSLTAIVMGAVNLRLRRQLKMVTNQQRGFLVVENGAVE